ncbi:MAG TPA: HD domain-containing phosphohydrolase, partial [Mariprofundaceae bacterium]|nr:HD domain-containing phosphohydrolase [Mariprofundaceae bacterium]
ATPDLVGMARMDGSIMYINPAGRRMIGIDDGAADPLTLNISEMHPEWARKPLLEEGIPAAIRDGVWTRETVLLARNDTEIPVLQTVLSHPGEDGNPAYVSTTMHDLRKLRELEGQTKKGRQALTTINRNLEEQVRKNKEVTQQLEHKMAEDDKTRQAMLLMLDDLNVSNAEVRKTNRALKLLSKCNGVLVHAEKEEDFLAEICKLAVETGGYMMAWIGFVEHDAARTVRPVAQSGYEDGYLEHIDITWADTERGQGPAGTAIRSQTTVINEDSLTNPNMAPWREDAIKRGYRSSIALPLTDRSRVPLGIFSLYAKEPHAFGEEEVVLLEELANEISYGITSLRTRIAHEQHTVVLRQSLEQSIQAIADTVEARDPYTAGHQRGVADLAVAIAREMRLTEDRIHGIHLAANIHDLGKIHVPAEILSKPGRLTEIEHQLIRTHPQAGYDIVKGIEFPWPIAQMILQHHEKMDGSGYPQGLKGEQILPESRIIAVADVVEAMSSHRPYRVGLGLDAALEEIERHRGVLYDPETVDACIRLFREQGYQLPAASPRPA